MLVRSFLMGILQELVEIATGARYVDDPFTRPE
jgi:hypothetical protein